MVAALVAAAMLAGCEQMDPSAPPTATTSGTTTASATAAATPTGTPAPDTTKLGALTGTWQGEWTNTTPIEAEGTFTLVWAQVGGRLIGAISVADSNCLEAGNVTGTVNGPQLRFGAVEGDVTVEYDGTLLNPDTIEGTYRSDCGPSTGTWKATRAQV